jgi:hypothetical protein
MTNPIPRGIVFHAYETSTQVIMLKDFLKKYRVIHALQPLRYVDEEGLYQKILDVEGGRPYDWPAFFWFGYRALLAKAGLKPISGFNKFQVDKARLCTGIAPTVLKFLGLQLPYGVDPELTPPHKLYDICVDLRAFISAWGWRETANRVGGHDIQTSIQP